MVIRPAILVTKNNPQRRAYALILKTPFLILGGGVFVFLLIKKFIKSSQNYEEIM